MYNCNYINIFILSNKVYIEDNRFIVSFFKLLIKLKTFNLSTLNKSA